MTTSPDGAVGTFFMCAGHVYQLQGESPECVLQCIVLANGKGVHREVESERSRQQTFDAYKAD